MHHRLRMHAIKSEVAINLVRGTSITIPFWIKSIKRGLSCAWLSHCNDFIMTTMAAQITSVSIVCSAVCSGADQRKHQSSASLAFVRGIHRWPVNSPHKWPVTRKMFPFDDVIMLNLATVNPVQAADDLDQMGQTWNLYGKLWPR